MISEFKGSLFELRVISEALKVIEDHNHLEGYKREKKKYLGPDQQLAARATGTLRPLVTVTGNGNRDWGPTPPPATGKTWNIFYLLSFPS